MSPCLQHLYQQTKSQPHLEQSWIMPRRFARQTPQNRMPDGNRPPPPTLTLLHSTAGYWLTLECLELIGTRNCIFYLSVYKNTLSLPCCHFQLSCHPGQTPQTQEAASCSAQATKRNVLISSVLVQRCQKDSSFLL